MTASHPKVLVATRTSPFAGESGSGTYVFELLRHLARDGFQIRVIWIEPPDLAPSRGWYAPPAGSEETFSLEMVGAIRFGKRFWFPRFVWLPIKAQASQALKTLLQRLGLWRRRSIPAAASPSEGKAPRTWGTPSNPEETAAVRRAIRRWKPDVVLANYAWMASAIRDVGQDVPPFAVLTHDVRNRQLHLREGVVVEVIGEHTSVEEEQRQLDIADTLIAIQHKEAEVFRRLFPNKTVVTAPMAVELRPLPIAKDPALLFVGSANQPNVRGLQWFVENVWPELHRQLPAARLIIAGSVCSAVEFALPTRVRMLGRLPDLAPAYAQSSAVIAPILQGSGVKIKILEAVSYGRACVTTSVGMEGLECLRPALRVADTVEDFVRETINLLAAPQETVDSLLTAARASLSAEACYGPVARVLRALASRTTGLAGGHVKLAGVVHATPVGPIQRLS
ncbi:MAG: glycosyltransferase [Terrimicrobiaceae bacterium]|nr:glycosyltransferase [Terrimicrobiaceae bacterium]